MDAFEIDNLARGSKESGFLEITPLPDGNVLKIPFLAARGQNDGPVISVLAGVHGDEYEGIQAVREVFARLDTSLMHGTFVGLPVVNPPAVQVGTRNSPVDGLNLARTFPGDAHGTVSQRIAYHVGERIIAPADLMIDLHTAGARYTMPLYCGYYIHDEAQITEKSRAAVLAFGAVGADVVVKHTTRPWVTGERGRCGSTVEVAGRKGIPCLYTESTGGGWLRPEVVSFYAAGVVNVMKHLAILPGQPVRREPAQVLMGPHHEILAPLSGFLVSEVGLLEPVKAGQRLGTLVGMRGEILAEVRAEHDGRVTMIRATPVIYSGEMAYALILRVDKGGDF